MCSSDLSSTDWAGKDCVWPLWLRPRSGVSSLCWVPLLAPRRAVKARLHRGPKADPLPSHPFHPNSSAAYGSRILSVPAWPFPERAHDGGTAAAALASGHSAGLLSHLAPPFPLTGGGFLVFANPQLDPVNRRDLGAKRPARSLAHAVYYVHTGHYVAGRWVVLR